ncbi:MAG: hypothetical protein H0Z18_02385 [Thermococcus sp.]|uniref:hypothetical protein n=1 Tax=Thermococcus sp. TaxID=35749 RepID=UPI001DE89D63|nr:hypothetical protein [Thermococcus sp.]MBO8174087.1 hypothetical protein [Thermococcus sp.]
MVKKEIYAVVLTSVSLIMLSIVYVIGYGWHTNLESAQKGDIVVFTGLCVYSKGDFSVITDGLETVMVYKNLTRGEIYTVRGKLVSKQQKAMYPLEVTNGSIEALSLSYLSGVYWEDYGCYILTPQKIKLDRCLNTKKGTKIQAKGVFYGNIFYVLSFEGGDFLAEAKDNLPYRVVGVVIDNRTPTIIWDGKEKVRVYLPYKLSLKLGDKVKILGIARLYSTLTLYVGSADDVKIIGRAKRKPIGEERIGDIAYGSCQVIKAGRGLSLNCTDLKLYSYFARTGDIVEFEALRREGSLVCLDCSVKFPREKLENSICNPKQVGIIKIEGRVSWVKIYKNGFGLANITDGGCWILLKLRRSLNLELKENWTITAFGVYTTYRGKPALEVHSREDVCLENSCLGF